MCRPHMNSTAGADKSVPYGIKIWDTSDGVSHIMGIMFNFDRINSLHPGVHLPKKVV